MGSNDLQKMTQPTRPAGSAVGLALAVYLTLLGGPVAAETETLGCDASVEQTCGSSPTGTLSHSGDQAIQTIGASVHGAAAPQLSRVATAGILGQSSPAGETIGRDSSREGWRLGSAWRIILTIIVMAFAKGYHWFRSRVRAPKAVTRALDERYEEMREADRWQPESPLPAGADPDAFFHDLSRPDQPDAPSWDASFGPTSFAPEAVAEPLSPLANAAPVAGIAAAATAATPQSKAAPTGGGEQGPFSPSQPAFGQPHPAIEQGPFTPPGQANLGPVDRSGAPTLSPPTGQQSDTSPLGQPFDPDEIFTMNGRAVPFESHFDD